MPCSGHNVREYWAVCGCLWPLVAAVVAVTVAVRPSAGKTARKLLPGVGMKANWCCPLSATTSSRRSWPGPQPPACMGHKPKIWTAIDRDYENLRAGMHTLFRHVGIETLTAAA